MSNIRKRSKKVEQEATAQANKSDASTTASHDESRLESSGENEQASQQRDADKSAATIHYYSRRVALDHGINAATVLAGFAFKLKYHKLNWWEDHYWYYETLETLCEHRWPYFSPSGLCGIVLYLSDEAKLLIKNCNNKASYDQTNWYAIEDDVRDAALSDSIWFDVRVAKMEKLGIAGATIYHNIRFHLRETLQADPTIGVPYHKVNMKQLARDLPMSYSTVKRMMDELVAAKLIVAHPRKAKWFTLTNLSELGLADSTGSRSDENGSFANRNGSNANGSDANWNGSSANKSGSSANENGSNANDNTQSETVKKHSQKHNTPTAARPVGSVCSNAAGAADGSRHQQSSSTVPGKEKRSSGKNASAHQSDLSALFDIAEKVKNLRASVAPALIDRLSKEAYDCAIGFVMESDSLPGLLRARFCKNSQDCLDAFMPDLSLAFQFPSDVEDSSGDLQEFWRLSIVRLVLAALLLHFHEPDLLRPAVGDCTDAVSDCYHALPDLAALTNLAPAQKATLLVKEINHYNNGGWPTTDGDSVPFRMPMSHSFEDQAVGFFDERPDLTAEDVALRMSDCIEVPELSRKPPGFDPLWHTRNGIRSAFLFKYWDAIALEVAQNPALR